MRDPLAAETFNVYAAIDDEVLPGTTNLVFDAAGLLAPDSATELAIRGLSAPRRIGRWTLLIDLSGVNNFGTQSTTLDFSQDGYPAGELLSFAFDDTGTLISTYTNGQQRAQGPNRSCDLC